MINREFPIYRMKEPEDCGICEQKGATIFWFSPYSRGAHRECFRAIQKAEESLAFTVDQLFKDTVNGERINAHIEAIRAVRKACGSETILSFFEKNGEEALSGLFNTVGIAGAKKITAKL